MNLFIEDAYAQSNVYVTLTAPHELAAFIADLPGYDWHDLEIASEEVGFPLYANLLDGDFTDEEGKNEGYLEGDVILSFEKALVNPPPVKRVKNKRLWKIE